MENALEVINLSKRYSNFSLSISDLRLPKGSIMGVIGENGAGKSTTIKLILNLINRNSGKIKVLGLDNIESEKKIKEQIGIVFDESNFPDVFKIKDINLVMKNIYKTWNDSTFYRYCKKFSLPDNKEVKDFSRGMQMKLSIATALAHNAKLLILDEPTSGLDPVVRDEILDVFLDFIQDDEKSIFISSHITSDLEKIADYITLIHKGNIVFSEAKDDLIYKYGILKCNKSEFEKIDKSLIIGHRESQFGIEALVLKDKFKENYIVDKVNIDDIMLFYSKGER